jgi:Fe-S cluster assembly iron-binding protein IscA
MVVQNEQDLNVPLHLNDQELTAWLARNREALREGKAVFNGVTINYETELTRFVRVTGLVDDCLRQYSRFFVCGVEPFDAVARAYTCHSLLFGWWAIPWGPLQTVHAIITNSRGGMRTRVLDLIGNETNDVVTLTERAAEAAQRQMAERGFPRGSGIRVDVFGRHRPRRYEITYDDLPVTEGREWIGQSHGVTILVSKKDTPRLMGLTIDFQDGRYTFDESELIWAD